MDLLRVRNLYLLYISIWNLNTPNFSQLFYNPFIYSITDASYTSFSKIYSQVIVYMPLTISCTFPANDIYLVDEIPQSLHSGRVYLGKNQLKKNV